MTVQLLKVGHRVTVAPVAGYPLQFTGFTATITGVAARGGITGYRDDRCKHTDETYRRETLPRVGCPRECRHMGHIGSMYVAPLGT